MIEIAVAILKTKSAVAWQLQILIFDLRLQLSSSNGVLHTVGKVLKRPFERYITRPEIPKILVANSKNQNSSVTTI
jgi:hypothetical protein